MILIYYAERGDLMKKFKKLLAVLLLVLVIGGLTACSQMNKVTKYFEEQGYVRYTYNNAGDSLLFKLHDDLFEEESIRLADDVEQTTTTAVNSETTSGDTVITTDNSNRYYGFISYAFSNDTYAVVVMEFESEEFLRERLAESAVLQAYFDGLNPDDYINGTCLLVVIPGYMDNYTNFINFFQ